MGKIRVYELAKELGIGSKDLLVILKKNDINVTTPMSSIDLNDFEKIKDKIWGVKSVESIENKIKPTVIRRKAKDIRKKEQESEKEAKKEVIEAKKEGIKEDKEIKSEEVKELEEKKDEAIQVERSEEIVEKEDETEESEAPKESKKRVIIPLKEEDEEDVYDRKGRWYAESERYNRAYRKKSLIKWNNVKGKSRFKQFPHLKRKKDESNRVPRQTEITIPKPIKRIIKIFEVITVSELAKKMGIKVGEIIKKLMELGVMANINQVIDADTAAIIASEYNYEVENVSLEFEESFEEEVVEDLPEKLVKRAPVVTIMGHVDHGKTSLLDAIRKTNVIGEEAGGITQHIGAYSVSLDNGDIVFLDTPGHEAFTTMRARGAQVTDIVVLVVAADDGVMPQTIEAINHAQAANVPIIVAINKIDKPNADPLRVKQSLTEYNLVPEEWGGDTIFVEISAKKRIGIKELLEFILIKAEEMDIKSNPNKLGRGVIIESRLDKGKGPVATILVQDGTIKVGDAFVAGISYGKIRAMLNDKFERVDKALPSTPVEIQGFPTVPEAGDKFIVVADERRAKDIVFWREKKLRNKEAPAIRKASLEDLHDMLKMGDVKELNVIVRGDVQGATEAIIEAFNKLETEAIKIRVIHSSVGDVTESDVMLASASKAIILGFNVKVDQRVMSIAEREGVEINTYDVIYDAITEIKKAMEGLIGPIKREVIIGKAEIRNTFNISKIGKIAGSYVIEGKILRNSPIRIIRNDDIIFEGRISSLKRFKDDVKEVASGYECGIGIEKFNDFDINDIIVCYSYKEEPANI
jgi:translation initiation factor IF-2